MTDDTETQDLDNQLLARMFQDFLAEAPEHLDQLNLNLIQLEEDPEDESLIDVLFRIAHTLKGSAAFVGLAEISEISRKMEAIFGGARGETLKITPHVIEIMYEGVDLMTRLLEKAAADERSKANIDVSPFLFRLDEIRENKIAELQDKDDRRDAETPDFQEVLSTFMKSYDQLVALKHIVYSSVHLTEPESLAVLLSKEIGERMSPQRNGVWLVKDHQEVEEIARNGRAVRENMRRVLKIESAKVLTRAILDQLVVWPSSPDQMKDVFPGFQRPVLFPIKAQPSAFGFIVLDLDESAELEVYQFICQFAAMMFNISKLHQKIEKQRQELNEMTDILLKQNERLSSLCHVEMDLMKANDPVDLCRIVVETVVAELEVSRAAAFLMDESSEKLIGVSGSGGLQEIDSIELAIDEQKPIVKAVESGRVVTNKDYTEKVRLGQYILDKWVVLPFKGRDGVRGVLVTEYEDGDVGDSISILVNHASTVLDNLTLQKKVDGAVK